MRPTRANRLRKEAEKFALSEQNNSHPAQLGGYELLLAQLNAHKRQLSQVQSMERRAEIKANIFAEYQPWIDGALNAGTGVQDAVLMTWLVWCIDAGLLNYALKIAEYALFHDLVLPERFERTLGTTVAEEFAELAKKARTAKKPSEMTYLEQVNQMTSEQDMPDQVRAKLLRELGEGLKETQPDTALAYLKRALELDQDVGVKGSITQLEKAIEKANSNTKEPSPPTEHSK